jgi:hypothetical protein
MIASLIGSSPLTGLFVFASVAALVIGLVHFLHHRVDPFRRLTRFRVRSAPGIRFQRLAYATLGDNPARRTWYRHTLSFAIDSDSIYLRHSLIPFFPIFWCLPRNQVRRCRHAHWTLHISAATPPLHADFGPGFIAALTQPK